MMKRTSLFFLGALAGAVTAVVIVQPRILINATANAAS